MTAYWIKEDQIIDVSQSRHILEVIKNPKHFGLTTKYIKVIYQKHHEILGSEQNAREELIKMVSKSGWIRVRKYRGKQHEYWSIQFDNYRKRNKVIQKFICWALTIKKVMTKTEQLRLVGFDDDFNEAITASAFLRENKINLRQYKKPTFVEIDFI